MSCVFIDSVTIREADFGQVSYSWSALFLRTVSPVSQDDCRAHISQDKYDLEPLMPLPSPPQCQDYRLSTAMLEHTVQEVGPGLPACLEGPLTAELHFQPPLFI